MPIETVSTKNKILLSIGIIAAFVDTTLRYFNIPVNFFSPVAYLLLMTVLLDNSRIMRSVLKRHEDDRTKWQTKNLQDSN